MDNTKLNSLDQFSLRITRTILNFRHFVYIALISALMALVFDTNKPVIAKLIPGLHHLIYIMALVSFPVCLYAACAFVYLLTRDSTFKIVEELRRGEAYTLLLRYMGVTAFLFCGLGMLSVIGLDRAYLAATFLHLYEWVLLMSFCMFGMVSFYFAVVLYKVKAHGDKLAQVA
jgi:hypothetical protein